MEIQEQQLVIHQLASSEARLLQLVEGLTPEQWTFRETPERWSIAENIEHVIAFENFIPGVITKLLVEPPEPEKKVLAASKERLVLGIANGRSVKFNARDSVQPVGRWPDPADLVDELKNSGARISAFTMETQADLRSHFFPHLAFGDLDCYQWLVLLGQHGGRHALQIEEIKGDPAYPKAPSAP